jgi:hypothetical protein
VARRSRQRGSGPAGRRDPSVAADPLGAPRDPHLHRRGDVGAGRHARSSRRGMGRPVRQLPRRSHLCHHGRVSPADARQVAAPGPERPGQARLQLGRGLRRARSSGGHRRLRPCVRKHLKLYASSEDGRIEAGPTHVHPALGPFAPPRAAQSAALNCAAAARARGYQLARARWRIGTCYRSEDRDTLLVRHRRQRPTATPAPAERPPHYPYKQSGPLTLGVAGAAAGGMLTALSGEPTAALAAALLPAGLAWAAARLGRVRAQLADALPLDRAAHAVLDAYQALGEMSGGGKTAPRPSPAPDDDGLVPGHRPCWCWDLGRRSSAAPRRSHGSWSAGSRSHPAGRRSPAAWDRPRSPAPPSGQQPTQAKSPTALCWRSSEGCWRAIGRPDLPAREPSVGGRRTNNTALTSTNAANQ